jgi:hypothetical protein
MASAPSLYVRVSTNIDDLKASLAEGKAQFETLTAAASKIAASFQGDRLVQHANNVTAAIRQVGVETLTVAEASRNLSVLDRAMEKLVLTGGQIPPAMASTAAELRKVAFEIEQLDKYGVQSVSTLDAMDARGSAVTSTYRKFDGVLAAMGLHIGPQVKGLEDIAGAAGKSAAQIGFLGTAGLALGSGYAGWRLGRMIADFFDLDQKIADAAARLLGYGDIAAEVGAAKQDVINRAIANGAKETIGYSEAIRFNIKHAQDAANAHVDWAARMSAAQKEIRGVSEVTVAQIDIARRLGATEQELTRDFGLSADALRILGDRLRVVADQKKALAEASSQAAKSEKEFWQEVDHLNSKTLPPFVGLLIDVERKLADLPPVIQEVEEEFSTSFAVIGQNAADVAARVSGAAQVMLGQLHNVVAFQNPYALSGSMSAAEQRARAAELGGSVAFDDFNNPYVYVPGKNAAPKARAAGGPVSAGQPYMVGERGPELFVPSQGGQIVPNGASTSVTVAPGAIVLNYPIMQDRASMTMLTQMLMGEIEKSLRVGGVRAPSGA